MSEASTNVFDDMQVFDGTSVLVTGHTGFKGSWLSLWLHHLGAKVTGYSLDPPSSPSNFEASAIADVLVEDIRGDIRDSASMVEAVRRARPELVLHLAAQPIVRASLADPRETFDVNVVGTASLLDAIRSAGQPCAIIVVTSDKCYRNEGEVWGFRECDPLGGHDPYSASKAGTELVVEAYRSSFFQPQHVADHGIRLASVRAGNVIGGGDWAADRIVPDAVRALSTDSDLVVRSPASTRPWQHVLEPLSGYLTLAERLLSDDDPTKWADAWNFGPLVTGEATVADLATAIVKSWGSGRWTTLAGAPSDVEAKTLRIAIDKAASTLHWRPRWDLDETVRRSVDWYRTFYSGPQLSMQKTSLADIEAYMASN